MNTLNVKKMNNYSITDQEENETLVFFYACCQVNKDEEEKNGRCFMNIDEALDYFEALKSEAGYYKRVDEFFINQEENTMGFYNNVCIERNYNNVKPIN